VKDDPRAGWALTALQWKHEELTVEYRPRVGAATARRIIAELFTADRIPPLPRPGNQPSWPEISIVSRLWLGARQEDDALYLIAVIDSHCLVTRVTTPTNSGVGHPGERRW
jgi:hypothetical protein